MTNPNDSPRAALIEVAIHPDQGAVLVGLHSDIARAQSLFDVALRAVAAGHGVTPDRIAEVDLKRNAIIIAVDSAEQKEND